MANARGKKVDNTFLSVDIAERRGFLHRDYIAHCFRWTHVVKELMRGQLYKRANVLDVGCGREVPLGKLMFSSRMLPVEGSYTGIEHGPILQEARDILKASFKHELHEHVDFMAWKPRLKAYDLVVSFEVMEHVEIEHCFAMLQKICQLTAPTGSAMISTPVYDPRAGAADNHVNEMSYGLFEHLLQCAGFRIANRWGTFASQRDYKNDLPVAWRSLYDQLSGYYDSNVLATFFAPLYPEKSRNVLWHVVPDVKKKTALPAVAGLADFAGPEHGSSENLAEGIEKIISATKKETKRAR